MFGSGPSEEIRLESETVEQQPPDQQESKARFDQQLDHEKATSDDGRKPGAVKRLKRWFAGKL